MGLITGFTRSSALFPRSGLELSFLLFGAGGEEGRGRGLDGAFGERVSFALLPFIIGAGSEFGDEETSGESLWDTECDRGLGCSLDWEGNAGLSERRLPELDPAFPSPAAVAGERVMLGASAQHIT